MKSIEERIAQFQNMVRENPDDDVAHFRLSQLLAEAGQHEAAAEAFAATIAISPQFSKAFQLYGESLKQLGKIPEAVEIWTRGWEIANERGDKIPRDAMAAALKACGAPVPETAEVVVHDGPDTGFRCQRPGCGAGRSARQLKRPPIPDALHKRIYETICQDCWDGWLAYSVKLINELRLDLSSEYAQGEYDRHQNEYFGFETVEEK
jgi:Fe-S cluster biosynthesis and repair protein YggX/predicted TPR repeat methyltransferase